MCNNKENAMNKVIDTVVDCCATDLGNGQKSLTRDYATPSVSLMRCSHRAM